MKTLTKEQWTEEVYALLCKSQGAPENETEVKNLREYADSIYEQAREDADDLKCEIMSPQEAHDEEMSCA